MNLEVHVASFSTYDAKRVHPEPRFGSQTGVPVRLCEAHEEAEMPPVLSTPSPTDPPITWGISVIETGEFQTIALTTSPILASAWISPTRFSLSRSLSTSRSGPTARGVPTFPKRKTALRRREKAGVSRSSEVPAIGFIWLGIAPVVDLRRS